MQFRGLQSETLPCLRKSKEEMPKPYYKTLNQKRNPVQEILNISTSHHPQDSQTIVHNMVSGFET